MTMDLFMKRLEIRYPRKTDGRMPKPVVPEIFELDGDFTRRLGRIVSSMRQAGYEPYAQLISYVNTGDDSYITRRGNARELVRTLDVSILREYLRSVRAG